MGDPAINNEADAWLAELDPSLAAQFQKLGEATADGAPGQASPFNTPTRSADSKPTRVRIVRVTDDELPPVKGVDLPTVEDAEVEITDRDNGNKKSKMKQSEVLKSPDYIDNGIKSLKAQPTQMTLEVKMMEIFYTRGGSIEIKMAWVKDGTNPLTSTYVRKDGMLIPVDQKNVMLFDGNNTPNILICAQYVKKEMRRRSEQRVQMAEIVAAFASAVAALGGAAAGVHEVTGGGGTGVHGGEEEEGGQGRRGAGGGEEEETGAGQRGESGGGDSSGGKSHDTGTADTQPAPPRRPEQGHPLDSTAEVKPKGGETKDTDSPKSGGTKDTDSPKGGGKGPPVEIKPVPRIPDNQEITVKTPRGSEKMTAGEYRRRWNAAKKWLGEENRKLDQGRGVPPPKELIKKAQEKFGLDDNWQYVSNPYIYGPL